MGERTFLVALDAGGEPRAAMIIDGTDSCEDIAQTLMEWHETDPNRRLVVRIGHAFSDATSEDAA